MKGLTVWIIFLPNAFCGLAPILNDDHVRYNHLLSPIASHFQRTKLPVVFWSDTSVREAKNFSHLDTLNVILRTHSPWMTAAVRTSTQCVRKNRLQNVFILPTYEAMGKLILNLDYDCFYPSGFYIFTVTEQCVSERDVKDVFKAVWSKRILNVVFIVRSPDVAYRAYGYEPYKHGNCGSVRLKLLDRYADNRWQRMERWFSRSLPNFHGCPLRAVTFETTPFVMLRTDAYGTHFSGLEVHIFEAIAAKLNFTIEYVTPAGGMKWGVLLPFNSTGQMGMLQRAEADVGFASVGRSIDRNIYLRSSIPSIVTQLSMTIPPKVPYTSLEKLFLPFSLPAWLLVAVGYAAIYCLYVALFRAKHHPYTEHIPGICYTIWTILMGGPGYPARRHSTRLYVISLVLNAFVVRNLYQSALFQYLKSNDVMAANLHTYRDINEAGLSYYMFRTTVKYYEDNSDVQGRIRVISDENTAWYEVMYNISQHWLPGVIPLPLETIFHYVKHYGNRGMVYVSEHTSISFFIAFHFPRMSALQQPFDYLLHQLHAGGFIVNWMSIYRDDRYTWMSYEQDGVPTPLDLHQVSGGFYLWACGTVAAMVVFAAELILSKVKRVLLAGPGIVKQAEHLQEPLRKFFRHPAFPINFRVQSSESGAMSSYELFTVNELMLENKDWLIGTVSSNRVPTVVDTYAPFYNVFLTDNYTSMGEVLQSLSWQHYDPSGRCLLVIDSFVHAQHLVQTVVQLWKLRIVNVVVVVRDSQEEASYRAFSYHPFRAGKCQVIEPSPLDRFEGGRWKKLSAWYRTTMPNFNGCTLKAGTVEAKPYSMVRREGNVTERFGMEVTVVQNIAAWFNFSIAYLSPAGKVKWGVIRAQNSTGLVGMIQRGEVDFGFGTVGTNVYRNRFLKMGSPSFLSQLNVAIPPDKPYSWWEKLYQPFSPAAWLCLTLCYAAFILATVILFDSKLVTAVEHFRNPAYNLWELLLGGPGGTFHRSSIRLFIAGFVLNALVVRTMYQSAMFQRLQATTRLGTKLNTFQQINDANLFYYMYVTTSLYYQDNSLLRGRIRILRDESQDWDEIMYDISQHKLNGVFAIPLDVIEYYVKSFGPRGGVVYVGRHTGFNYNLGIYYPKASPLTEPFNTMVGRYQAAGLMHIWRERFRDTRYWSGVKSQPEPISLQWHHVSGAFYVWVSMLAAGSLLAESNLDRSPPVKLLSSIVTTHYRAPESYVALRTQNGNSTKPTFGQRDLLDELMRHTNDWMLVTLEDLPMAEGRPAYYNVFLVQDYGSLCTLLDGMTYQTHHFYGLYTIVMERLTNPNTTLHAVMEKLWSLKLMNVVVIVQGSSDESFIAYTYHPYREQKCGIVEPYAVDRYENGSWSGLAHWYPTRTQNFNGCPLIVGTVDIKPCSIVVRHANRIAHKGIEVAQVLHLAKKFNFTVHFVLSDGDIKWGFVRPVNSTGLMGMIQRSEVEFGFGSIGIGWARVQFLRQGTPSRYGQILMAIPPKRPYTSLEKLFQPFSLQTWLCVVFCLLVISMLARAMFRVWKNAPADLDRLPNAFYTMWVLTMGGPCQTLRMDSSRIFIVIFVLNMLVLRTLYHAGMFERLQASDSLASDLNTLEQINRAGKMYHMHKTITLYFNDNPLVGPRRIRTIQHDSDNWEDLLYMMSQQGSDFVVALPLDCIKYYVKMNGERGLVYVGKHTGILYNTAFYYPKTTSLQEPFSTLVLAFHTAGLVNHWAQEFEDNRFWSNAVSDPEPASIKWDHISGAFYLTGTMHLLAIALGSLWTTSPGTRDTHFLSTVLREHYREVESEVHIRVWHGNVPEASPFQDELVGDITRTNADWMIVSFGDLAALEHRLAYYNVLLVLDYDAFSAGLQDIIEGGGHHFHGLYTFFIEQLADRQLLGGVMQKLWSIPIMNALVILAASDSSEYIAYSYYPYQAGLGCGLAEPRVIGRYANGAWDRLGGLFPDKLANLHGCPLTVATVEINPFSMVRTENNRTVHYGIEVDIVETLAARLNFTIRYVGPKDNSKWGIIQASNSTGLVGMLQRHEADFGFGSLGFSLSRHTYLKMGIPNRMSQMIMAIPPKRPYTSLEKLFQPFTADAWLCIGLGYAVFGIVTMALVKLRYRVEQLSNPLYLLWVLLMGGSGARFGLDSTRLFMIGFILNTLVIRTLYQAGMFQRLQSSASLASDFNTLDAINKAGVYYNMFRASLQFYKDNPKIPASRIRLVQNDHQDWGELFYLVAHDRLGGVMVSPYDCIAYYVKVHGKDGVVYVGRNTGFMYNLGFHYPKSTPLQGPFDAWILRMHTSGLIHSWSEKFRDNRYWSNAKEDPEPASLKWNQISGGFYLCSLLLCFASIVFLGELMHHRLRTSRLFRCKLEPPITPEKEA
uniref:Ionotropic glutamate receptor L-glutamate and glycine-binding domain-containing protein n=1 Tax=Anopheles stephensi TaxID=30069 RepID=A0A182Y3V8_ANOST